MSSVIIEELKQVASQLKEDEQKKLLQKARYLLAASIAGNAYNKDFEPVELSDDFLRNELSQMRTERDRKNSN